MIWKIQDTNINAFVKATELFILINYSLKVTSDEKQRIMNREQRDA